MSAGDSRLGELDARMRRLLAGVDATAGFEARVMQRVAAQAARVAAPRADLREQYERRRELARRRLRREAWSNGVTIAGIGLAAAALVWRFREPVVQWVMASEVIDGPGPMLLVAVALGALGAGLWPQLRRALDR